MYSVPQNPNFFYISINYQRSLNSSHDNAAFFLLIRMQRDHFDQSKSTTRELSSICAIEKRRGQLALLTNQRSLRLDRAVRFKCDVYADCSQRRPVLTIFASQSPALEPGQGCGSIFFGHLP